MVTHSTKVVITALAATAIVLTGLSTMRTGSADTSSTSYSNLSADCQKTVGIYASAIEEVSQLGQQQADIRDSLSRAATDSSLNNPTELAMLKQQQKLIDDRLASANKDLEASQSSYAACIK